MMYGQLMARLGNAALDVGRLYAARGASRDKLDKRAMVEAIVAWEDRAEMQRPRNKGLRESVRAVRRGLEVEVWP